MPEGLKLGVLIPNPFVRIPVEDAVQGLGGVIVTLRDAPAARTSGCRVILADIAALEDGDIRALVQAGCGVIVFAAPEDAGRLAAARLAGAVALPRAHFLERLPKILASAGASSPRKR